MPLPCHPEKGVHVRFKLYHFSMSGSREDLFGLLKQWNSLCTRPGSIDSWYDQCKTSDPSHDLASTIATVTRRRIPHSGAAG
ncbi:predicted protein [Coccidioides posadasii str. Silveira]|uniref:Predicted protein n=1 Tax=Coccidioides posadasii (strain RMSCC 757 / Silveira) TaxID=443226 RepID=E9D8V9_COCPS|nr:predicted protein [Coccidioides posadasii str. Silveira]